MMSGSGPSVFGIFEDDDTFSHAEAVLRQAFPEAVIIATSVR
jgi:4-diphosphocytidyl-2C-methyl-D-erythritol kinase